MYMYYRPSLLDRFISFMKSVSVLLLCIAIYLCGVSLKSDSEKAAYAEYLAFLEDVNLGLYDHRDQYPEGFRIGSLEHCIDGRYYLSGYVDAYAFKGYTSAKKPTAEMQWKFYASPGNGNIELFLQAIGFAGSMTCFIWLVVRRLFKLPSFPECIRAIGEY